MRIGDWSSDVCSSDLAALLAVGIAAQHVLAAEARADRPLLVGVVDRHLRPEEVLQRQAEAGQKLRQQETLGLEAHGSHGRYLTSRPFMAPNRTPPARRPSAPPTEARTAGRTEDRRVGKECVRTGRTGRATDN